MPSNSKSRESVLSEEVGFGSLSYSLYYYYSLAALCRSTYYTIHCLPTVQLFCVSATKVCSSGMHVISASFIIQAAKNDKTCKIPAFRNAEHEHFMWSSNSDTGPALSHKHNPFCQIFFVIEMPHFQMIWIIFWPNMTKEIDVFTRVHCTCTKHKDLLQLCFCSRSNTRYEIKHLKSKLLERKYEEKVVQAGSISNLDQRAKVFHLKQNFYPGNLENLTKTQDEKNTTFPAGGWIHFTQPVLPFGS